MNSLIKLRNILRGVRVYRGTVLTKTAQGYSVSTQDGTKFYTSALDFKVGDEVSITGNTIQPANDGLVFYV